jgi:hypothetical protein
MTRDFEHTRAAAAQSLAGRALPRFMAAAGTAWTTSVIGQSLRRATQPLATASSAELVRWCATAIAIAAMAHLMLRAMMPATVAPSLPAVVIVALAAIAATAAWKADTVSRAWQHSRLSRLFNRGA